MSLDPIDPDTTFELYLADEANDLEEASLGAHEYRLNQFVRWCDEDGIRDLDELSGRKLYEFGLWRRADGDRNEVSEERNLEVGIGRRRSPDQERGG